ncbi:MAG: Asp23/Gls24 family envelope stress response protein [Clostridiales bacterium]|jgi:uncharacterized alkaline shock family protein YloU|nr:MAG: Asp23/Gls24 family envelope stress response protein [Clostridiales bacterium]
MAVLTHVIPCQSYIFGVKYKRNNMLYDRRLLFKGGLHMAGTIITELGRITIDEDILANIAGYAATENYGVVGMKPRTATDTFLQLVGNDTNRKRGVKITFLGDGSEADVDLFVTMVYGVSLQVVAKNTIDNVRYRVEEMTGIKVNSVNIHVENITA